MPRVDSVLIRAPKDQKEWILVFLAAVFLKNIQFVRDNLHRIPKFGAEVDIDIDCGIPLPFKVGKCTKNSIYVYLYFIMIRHQYWPLLCTLEKRRLTTKDIAAPVFARVKEGGYGPMIDALGLNVDAWLTAVGKLCRAYDHPMLDPIRFMLRHTVITNRITKDVEQAWWKKFGKRYNNWKLFGRH